MPFVDSIGGNGQRIDRIVLHAPEVDVRTILLHCQRIDLCYEDPFFYKRVQDRFAVGSGGFHDHPDIIFAAEAFDLSDQFIKICFCV